jgi:hypothetical protein
MVRINITPSGLKNALAFFNYKHAMPAAFTQE